MIWMFACAPDLRPSPDLDFADTDGETPIATDLDDRVTQIGSLDGTNTVRLSASASDSFVYFQFWLRDEVGDDDIWDLRFQRYEGVIPQNVTVSIVDGATLDEVSRAPLAGWATDGETTKVLADWYDYDSGSHVLTPKPRVYVFHRADDTYVKLMFLDYYDDAGNSGYPTFEYGAVVAP